MATTTTKPNIEIPAEIPGIGVSTWPGKPGGAIGQEFSPDAPATASHSDALQALLAFSALHEQVRRRKALASRRNGFDAGGLPREFESNEHFVLDEVLHLVAERAIAITGADGLAIALAENNEIVLRASAGTIKPDVGARLDRESAFSGACFRTAQIVRCDDTESDDRVNLHACRRLGARSMIAVPLCGRRRVIGLLEAFSAEPFGFNDSDVHSLSLLAELILGALKPEDEDRFAESASVAATALESAPVVKTVSVSPPIVAPPVRPVAAAVVAPKVEVAPSAAVSAAIVTPKIDPVRSVAVPAPVLPVTKPVEVAARVLTPSPVVPAIPREAVTAPAPVAAEETIVETATALDTDIALDAPAAGHKHGILIALVLVMMAAVATAGVWWKIKNAQVGSVMVQSPKPVLKPVVPAEPVTTAAGPASGAAADAGLDALSTPSSASTTPATPQELSKFPVVSGVREWSSADSTTVVLDLQDQVQYEAHRLSNPDRIFFDLRDTALAPELAGKTIEVSDALLHRIRVAQPVPGTTRVVLEIKGNSTFSVSLEPNPYRLVVQVHKVGTAPKGAVNLFPGGDAEKNRMAIVIPPPGKEDLQLRARVPKMRIVVDAGHGGWDLGTVGRRGLLEKDLVLEIGQRLGKLLESRLGADVIYTRQDDTYIPLDERASIANQSQADLFVSVHGNNSDLPSARGIETYYSNSVSTPSAKDLETRAGNSKNMVSAALSSAGLHERIEQSRRLAASVQRSLYGTLAAQNPGLRDRGVKEAGFVVLTESAMPGILAEVSFVSSPTDEQKLRSDGYREQIAEALYKGIARYAASGTRGVKVASSGR